MSMKPNVAKAVEPIMERLNRQPPVRRVMMANELYQQLLDLQAGVAASKRSAIREMRAQGQTLSHIADQIGLTTSRVKQIESGTTRKPTNQSAQEGP